jgi:hypothetical protein
MSRIQASGVALFVALLAVALAVLTWLVWTVCEVLVSLTGLGVLLYRTGRTGLRLVRALVVRGRALVGVALLLIVVTPAPAQEVVIDPSNLIQNTISALKMIESVINEATMIANQLEQIRVMIQNTTNYPEGIWDREALPRLSNSVESSSRSRRSPIRSATSTASFASDIPATAPSPTGPASTTAGPGPRSTRFEAP